MKTLLALSFVALAGCASAAPPDPAPIRLASFGTIDQDAFALGHPIILEIHEGETIPLDLTVGGDLVEVPPNTTIPVTAKRTFYLRIAKEGVSISRDGRTFGQKARVPGSFRVGVGATRERGVRGQIVLTTPEP